jgi:phospholipid transport system transporter-binding protein
MAELVPSAEGFVLQGELSYRTAPDLFEQSRLAMASAGASCEVDLRHITRTDSAGLALLVGIARLCRERGKTTRMQGAPDQLLALARANKLDRLLGLA